MLTRIEVEFVIKNVVIVNFQIVVSGETGPHRMSNKFLIHSHSR